MNPRVLELLKNPKHIQSEDLHLLKEEINSFPYVQNIRALHLYAVHLFEKENYQKELSTTAAYTTDKKILYQLINGKIQPKVKPEVVEKKEIIEEKTEQKQTFEARNAFNYIYQKSSFPLKRDEKEDEVINSITIPINEVEKPVEAQEETIINDIKDSKENKFEEASCLLKNNSQPETKHVFVNGERNRILFEGEENFLEDENTETIDLESTLESGTIVTQKSDKQENVESSVLEEKVEENKVEETANLTPETIINEDKIASESEKEKIEDDSDVSFLETETLSPEITSESNDIEEIKEDAGEVVEEQKAPEISEFTPETIINEDEITSETEKETIDDSSELSFHGTESFLPEVKIQSGNIEEEQTKTSQSNINKHEDEMRRLIEEVERKMKESKVALPEEKAEAEEIISHDISFAETQSFEVKSEEKEEILDQAEIVPENNSSEAVEEPKKEIQETVVESEPEIKSEWKPMSFESHVPDSLLNKKTEPSQAKVEVPIIETPKAEVSEEESPRIGKSENEDVPVMNVSFFGSDISSWKPNEKVKEEPEMEDVIEEVPQEVQPVKNLDSNIPGFINTWQSWLKIDRADEVEEAQEVEKEKTEIKTKAIETFIETNPRISQLKEESSFVVREKTDDISHLMTETLANLYIEQKLYTKATKAFEILMKKHPEKKEHFESKIQEIKDIRNKN